MGNRKDLNDLFLTIVPNVYFQPPESVKMKYPAIRYSLGGMQKTTANNEWYSIKTRYTVTLIRKEPDSDLPLKVEKLNKCHHVQQYKSENLYHDVYELEF